MIRVGLVLSFKGGWLGGINYFRNLISAVYALSGQKIELVVFTNCQTSSDCFEGFPPIEVVRSDLFDDRSVRNFARKVWKKLFSHDLFLERLLNKHRVVALSHSGLVVGSKIPSLCWIPDFQHNCLPELFDELEIRQRDQLFQLWCTQASTIILSSQDSKKDLLRFFPDCAATLEVLQFVAGVSTPDRCSNLIELKQRYNIKEKYFLVPNQFWKHKNHRVVIDALSELIAEGRDVVVLATGSMNDHRHPDFFNNLMSYAAERGVSENFKVLGMVPAADLAGLMTYALALINPSLFEGWSTSVEEAKSMGKRILLSDIPVHREQNPPGGLYFNPHDHADLAQMMWDLWITGNEEATALLALQAKSNFYERQRLFGAAYQNIVLRAIQEPKSK